MILVFLSVPKKCEDQDLLHATEEPLWMWYIRKEYHIIDKVLLESSKNPYTYMIFDVFGTLFILEVLL